MFADIVAHVLRVAKPNVEALTSSKSTANKAEENVKTYAKVAVIQPNYLSQARDLTLRNIYIQLFAMTREVRQLFSYTKHVGHVADRVLSGESAKLRHL